MRQPVRLLLALMAVLAVIAGVVYAATPEPHVLGADRVVGGVPHLEKRSMVLWIGDSFTAGTGSDDGQDSYVALVSTRFDWAWATDAEGGTGFLNNGHEASPHNSALPDRLAGDERAYHHVDLVVIDAGRDDGGSRPSSVEPVAEKYFNAVSAAWPQAQVLVIAPYYLQDSDTSFSAFRTFERAQAHRRGWYFIDPLTQGWISPANSSNLFFRDHIHPDERGQHLIAANLDKDIESSSLLTRIQRTGPSTLVSG